MKKGEATRQEIIRRVAPVLNQQGFAGSSLADMMQATGLHKGGIYNHFDSKEQLALEAFDYAADLMRQRWERAISGSETALGQLEAFLMDFSRMYPHAEIEGGCPLLNTAIESDDTNPPLRDRVRWAFSYWRGCIADIVRRGQQHGEMRVDADADGIATLLISAMEGALMLSQLEEDATPLHTAAAHLVRYLHRELVV